MSVSERRVCRVLGQHRSTQRRIPTGREDEERLTADIIELARQYGRYGYRKIAELLRNAGWVVNDKRVERIWRREGLKVPHKQPKRGRLWLSDGSCIRLRPEHRNHVWSYDFVEDRTHDGRKYRMLNVIDEFTHECLAIRVARKLKAIDVIDVLSDLFILRGVPGHIRSDNSSSRASRSISRCNCSSSRQSAALASNIAFVIRSSIAWPAESSRTRASNPLRVTTPIFNQPRKMPCIRKQLLARDEQRSHLSRTARNQPIRICWASLFLRHR